MPLALVSALLLLVPALAVEPSGRLLQEERSNKEGTGNDADIKQDDSKTDDEKKEEQPPSREERCNAAIEAHKFAVQAQGLDDADPATLPDGISEELATLMKQVGLLTSI